MGAEPELPGDVGEDPHVDRGRPELGHLPLRKMRELREDHVRHDEAQHGIAQELQPLVVGDPAVLEGIRAVRERISQQIRLTEADAELVFEFAGAGALCVLSFRGLQTTRSRRPRVPRSTRTFRTLCGASSGRDTAGRSTCRARPASRSPGGCGWWIATSVAWAVAS